ncbi:MAG: DegV family protein [Chloroflexi bacterium]|nr:DegV family protein [Chloroflexota bacterium]
MPFVGLVSDSTPGFSDEFVAKYHLRIVPLYIRMGDETLRDGVDIKADEFYRRLPELPNLPTTSQPSAGDFQACYQALVDEGATGIVSVHLSSGVSGTINSATLAAQEVSVPVEIVDTQSASAAQIFAVEAAGEAIAAGANAEQAAEAARRVCAAQRIIFAVDTLEYLYKGGRIGGAAALVGSLLQFKPLLYFHEGKIDALERVRTSARAARRMLEIMGEWMAGQGPLRAMVLHAVAPERADELADEARRCLDIVDLQIAVVPPVLGTYTGPGTVGMCCCPISAFENKG